MLTFAHHAAISLHLDEPLNQARHSIDVFRPNAANTQVRSAVLPQPAGVPPLRPGAPLAVGNADDGVFLRPRFVRLEDFTAPLIAGPQPEALRVGDGHP